MTLDYYCASVRARVKKCLLSQNRAKSLTKATRAVDTAESSKLCGSFEAIFSTSMAPLMDGDKVATIAEEVDSSTLTLTADRGEAEVSSFSKMAKIKRRRGERSLIGLSQGFDASHRLFFFVSNARWRD